MYLTIFEQFITLLSDIFVIFFSTTVKNIPKYLQKNQNISKSKKDINKIYFSSKNSDNLPPNDIRSIKKLNIAILGFFRLPAHCATATPHSAHRPVHYIGVYIAHSLHIYCNQFTPIAQFTSSVFIQFCHGRVEHKTRNLSHAELKII